VLYRCFSLQIYSGDRAYYVKNSISVLEFHVLHFHVLLFHVRQFHVLQFRALLYGPSVSGPPISCPSFSAPRVAAHVVWTRVRPTARLFTRAISHAASTPTPLDAAAFNYLGFFQINCYLLILARFSGLQRLSRPTKLNRSFRTYCVFLPLCLSLFVCMFLYLFPIVLQHR